MARLHGCEVSEISSCSRDTEILMPCVITQVAT